MVSKWFLLSFQVCEWTLIITLSFIQVGKTKVFLRAGQMAELDARRTEVLSRAAQIIQRRMLTYIAHKQFIETRKGSIVMQSFCRGETLTT